jgi:Kef-type K+ transport system membrane component KefB
VNPAQTANAFFGALCVILLACLGMSRLARRVGQPSIVAQMATGVLLGPSVLGLLWPHSQPLLFPAAVRPLLYAVGQFGLIVFMFRAGREFKTNRPKGAVRSAAFVSSIGSAAPLVLGTVAALWLGHWAGVFQTGTPVLVTAAFVGVTLTVTAFPMVASIVQSRGYSRVRFGPLALACGAIDDVVAWLLLAAVTAAAAGSSRIALIALVGGLAFAAVTWGTGRRFFTWRLRRSGDDGRRLVWVIVAVLGAACFTDEIGLYTVFGAFCVGMVLPETPAADRVVEEITPLAQRIFLPVFFVYSGLNTRFSLIASPQVLIFTGACVAAAIIGKLGGCWAAARLSGESNATSTRLGTLMNARGLMQLIALNVGLQDHIVGGALFASLVVVAFVTTVMAAPLLVLADQRWPIKAPVAISPETPLTAPYPKGVPNLAQAEPG